MSQFLIVFLSVVTKAMQIYRLTSLSECIVCYMSWLNTLGTCSIIMLSIIGISPCSRNESHSAIMGACTCGMLFQVHET